MNPKILTRTCILYLALTLPNLSYAQQENSQNADSEKTSTEKTDKEATPSNTPKPTLAPLTEIRPEDQETLKQTLLKAEVKQEEIEWLNTQQGQILGLWRPDTSGIPQGAVLILHDDGEHPAWPVTINPVRLSLSQHGWATFSLSMPNSTPQTIPERPIRTPKPTPSPNPDQEKTEDGKAKKNEKKEEKNNDKKTEHEKATDALNAEEPPIQTPEPTPIPPKPRVDPEQEAMERLRAAIDFLNNKGQYNIIIYAEGTSVIRALKLLPKLGATKTSEGQTGPLPIRAMVFLEADNALANTESTFENSLSSPDMPILDLYFPHKGEKIAEIARNQAKQRKAAAKAQGFKTYLQAAIPYPERDLSEEENALSRRIRGFLNKYARGVELKRK